MSVRLRVFTVGAAALAWVGLLPAIAQAQGTTAGAVAGVVRDTTGAVLPGVTVEAASPALIEKVRSGVTNEQGQFQIVNLPPGAYTVTFTLPGFRTLRREGIGLSAGFTATVNVELSVGGVEETLTVTGETPLVDTHATNAKTTFTRETMDAMPVAKNFAAMAVLIPGVQILASSANSQGATQDVGGTMGERNNVLTFHGSAAGDMPQNLDGMRPGRGSGVRATCGWPTTASSRKPSSTHRASRPKPRRAASRSTSLRGRAGTGSRAPFSARTPTTTCRPTISTTRCGPAV